MKAHRAANQARQAVKFRLGIAMQNHFCRAGAVLRRCTLAFGRRGCLFSANALLLAGVEAHFFVHHYSSRNTGHRACRIFDIANRLVNFIVSRGPLAVHSVFLQGVIGACTGLVGLNGGGRWRIGNGTRNTLGCKFLGAVLGQDFRACLRPCFGVIKVFNRHFTLGEVHADIHLGTYIALTKNGNKQLHDAGVVGLLNPLLMVELGIGKAHGGVLATIGKKVANVVHHRHVLSRQIGNA